MEIETVVNFDTLVVKIYGKMDQTESDDFVNSVNSQLTSHIKNVEIDAAGMNHVSSYGVFTLVNLKKNVEENGGEMRIVNVPENIKKIFSLLNFTHE